MDAKPTPAATDSRDWTFVIESGCPQCGYRVHDPLDTAGRLLAGVPRWEAVLRRDDVARRPSSEVWSPLEYASHSRDCRVLARHRGGRRLSVGVDHGFRRGTVGSFAGVLSPVYWVAGALLGAYIRAAATLPMDARRSDVVDKTIRLGLTHPIRTLLSVPLVLATAPVWVLPPITVACGLSVPAWAVSSMWGVRVAS